MLYEIAKVISQDIFRAYDIRGVVDKSFTENNIYTIGLALGSEALERGIKTLAVGRDGRISGPSLSRALIAGILATGCNVIDIGEVTTPILYYQAALMADQSGIMLSGSHNPPEYNGIKIVLKGEAIYGEAIQALYQRIIAQRFCYGTGELTTREIIPTYVEQICQDVKLARQFKVVVDCGNGIGGKVAPNLLRSLGCEVVELYCEVDGNFPNHHPDPAVPSNLHDLQEMVKKEQADLGLAFDGDADRVGIVTETGEIIAADRLLTVLAVDLLTRHPGAQVIFDVKCGRQLPLQIERHGGVPVMSCTGHSLIKAKMRETGVLLAGELSGHTFMKERWFGFDDGIYVAARFLEILAATSQRCSELFAAYPASCATPELKLPLADERKFIFMREFQQHAQFPEGKCTTIDGLRVDFADGFGLMRPSNTTPCLVLRFEGDTWEAVARIQQQFKMELLKLDPQIKVPF